MEIDFDKMDGLVPAVIQDAETKNVLMLGFMNREAYDKTLETGKVTFFSRSKTRLWTKGETSGNFLHVVSIKTVQTGIGLISSCVHKRAYHIPVSHQIVCKCVHRRHIEDRLLQRESQTFCRRRTNPKSRK